VPVNTVLQGKPSKLTPTIIKGINALTDITLFRDVFVQIKINIIQLASFYFGVAWGLGPLVGRLGLLSRLNPL